MENLEQPKIDKKEIQKRANEAANKAYLDEIERYYTGHNSPYKNMIQEELKKQDFKFNMKLPNILEKINDSLSQEIDKIANNAVTLSYIPMVSKVLVELEDKEPKMSWFLKEIIKETEPQREDYEEFDFSYEKNERYEWLNCQLTTPENYYEFTLHKKKYYGKEEDKHKGKAYNLLSFPHNKFKTGYNSNMKVRKDNVEIEMPFTPNILQDKVLGIFFKLILNDGLIILDCENFQEDMFPEDDHCIC